jgi:hypothetical protein
MFKKLALVATLVATAGITTGATAQPASWWVAGVPVSGNPVACSFVNDTAVPLRISIYRFHVPGRSPYVFQCDTNCIVAPGLPRVMVSPVGNLSNFVFTCDGLISNY